jgi:DNA-binding NarL/FixJ family response regulator
VPDVFVSYRREDSEHIAGWLCQNLSDTFGADRIFKDDVSIEPGARWPDEVRTALEQCKVVLVIIGEHWLAASLPYNLRRIDNPEDWVHQEIATAFRLGKIIIPVTVKQVEMPPPTALPPQIQGISRLQAMQLRSRQDDFKVDADRIVKRLAKHIDGPFQPELAHGQQAAKAPEHAVGDAATKNVETRPSNLDSRVRVLIVDDHPMICEGLCSVINSQRDMEVVAMASNGREAIRQFREHRPDVTLMDLRLPDVSGIEAMIAIRTEFPEARVLIQSTFAGDVEIQRALATGAHGYLLKSMSPNDFVDAIRQVYAGKKRISDKVAATLQQHIAYEELTSREVEVLRRIAEGNRNKDIAESLFISEETVKVHVKHIMDKLEAKDRTQAITIAVRRGIIQL